MTVPGMSRFGPETELLAVESVIRPWSLPKYTVPPSRTARVNYPLTHPSLTTLFLSTPDALLREPYVG
jgi:hypothetical protein